jgi:hypothetical protein
VVLDRGNGILQAVKHRLAQLLGAAQNPGQSRSNVDPEFDGALQEV